MGYEPVKLGKVAGTWVGLYSLAVRLCSEELTMLFVLLPSVAVQSRRVDLLGSSHRSCCALRIWDHDSIGPPLSEDDILSS